MKRGYGIEDIFSICRKYEKIYIYGAGKNAGLLYEFLIAHEIEPVGFIVSDRGENAESLFGKPITELGTFLDHSDRLIIVSVSSKSRAYKEILRCLVEKMVHDVYVLTNPVLELIKEDLLLQKTRHSFNTGIYYLAEKAPTEMRHAILAMKGAECEEYHWRVSQWSEYPSNIAEAFQRMTALEEFERAYGKYHIFHRLSLGRSHPSTTCTVYMARSHVDSELKHTEVPNWLIPIQVGAALTERVICDLKDNTGENISERNGNYSECTALYWMWKNAPKTDYIGLCHYRRHFDLDENELRCLADLDVLATSPTFVAETAGAFFSTLTPQCDLDAMLAAIEKVRPEYLQAAQEFLEGRFFPPCNLFLMKYDLFQEYGDYLFSITFEIERFFDNLNIYRSDRYLGYLAECLMGIFLMRNKGRLKIGYTDMRFLS